MSGFSSDPLVAEMDEAIWEPVEPRQITGQPLNYYGYVMQPGRPGSLRHCHYGGHHASADAARACAAKTAREFNIEQAEPDEPVTWMNDWSKPLRDRAGKLVDLRTLPEFERGRGASLSDEAWAEIRAKVRILGTDLAAANRTIERLTAARLRGRFPKLAHIHDHVERWPHLHWPEGLHEHMDSQDIRALDEPKSIAALDADDEVISQPDELPKGGQDRPVTEGDLAPLRRLIDDPQPYGAERRERAAEVLERVLTELRRRTAEIQRLRGFPGHVQRCSCGRADGIDWGVADDVWAKVGASGVLCLPCFDALAEQAGVEYRLSHLYFVSERGVGPDFTEVDRDRHGWIGKAHDRRERAERAEGALRAMVQAFAWTEDDDPFYNEERLAAVHAAEEIIGTGGAK